MPRIVQDYDAELCLTDDLGMKIEFGEPVCDHKVYTVDPYYTNISLKDCRGTLSVDFKPASPWYANGIYYSGFISGALFCAILCAIFLGRMGITGYACKVKILKKLDKRKR